MKKILLALLVLFLIKVVLANEDEQSLPFQLPIFGLEGINASSGEYSNQGQCGKQGHHIQCLDGMCCSLQGYCGNTPSYCAPGYCQSQCPDPFPPGRCGWQADNTSCSTGKCCKNDGWCGNTTDYCDPGISCQSQCTEPLIPPGRCGWQANGTSCSTGECCSNDGLCGTTPKYCDPPNCRSQCQTPPASHSSLSPLLVGLFIFLIVVALVFYRRFANSPMFSS
ncbi:chitin-binding lectin 1-like [Solanum tuberosum]|uniref:42kDa chitin-binding protein n=1 Tax=Solanum tuberosum TaxID=4113 RepID=M1BQ34_SOLTU|nr:PREDICTED: chitin-binding lectin 1-like [Solanum tuberosum]